MPPCLQDHRPASFEVSLHQGTYVTDLWSKLTTGGARGSWCGPGATAAGPGGMHPGLCLSADFCSLEHTCASALLLQGSPPMWRQLRRWRSWWCAISGGSCHAQRHQLQGLIDGLQRRRSEERSFWQQCTVAANCPFLMHSGGSAGRAALGLLAPHFWAQHLNQMCLHNAATRQGCEPLWNAWFGLNTCCRPCAECTNAAEQTLSAVLNLSKPSLLIPQLL